MFGVKVGESSEIDVYMGMHWGIGSSWDEPWDHRAVHPFYAPASTPS